ncbi:MAG: HU family DNA-binding protein [Rhodobacteraceae bacterium]|nr:HU family DNA-binding protein [Paracoccaceae bacterium]
MAEDASQVVERGTALKLRELVNRVAEATGGKKKGLKEIVEATLAQLGAALEKREELNLPGMGKVRVARSADKDGRSMMTLKARGVGTARKKEPTEALAEADEAV